MKRMYLVFMALLFVGANVIGMEFNGKYGFFEGLTPEQLQEFESEMTSGVIAGDFVRQYNELEEKRISRPNQFTNKDCKALADAEDMLEDIGLGYFVLISKMKKSYSANSFGSWQKNGSDKPKKNLMLYYSSSSSSSDDETNKWKFVNYREQEIAELSSRSSSSSEGECDYDLHDYLPMIAGMIEFQKK